MSQKDSRRADRVQHPERGALARFFRSETGRATGFVLAFFAGMYGAGLLGWIVGAMGMP